MKLKGHVSKEMITKYFNEQNIRLEIHDNIIHVSEELNAEYDMWFNLETREIKDFGLYGDGIIEDMKKLGWI